MRLNRPVLLSLAVLLAGCTSPGQEPTCQGDECGPTTPPLRDFTEWPPETPFPNLPLNESLRSLRYERCTGLVAAIELPESSNNEAVPDDFSPHADLLPQSSPLGILAFTCDRVVTPTGVLEHVSELHLAPKVRPINQSWAPEVAASFFLIDRFVSSPELGENLTSLGLPATVATIAVTRPLGDASTALRWEVSTSSERITFQYEMTNTELDQDRVVMYLWNGPDPYLRSVVRLESRDDVVQEGIITFDGESRSGKIVGAPAVNWDGSPFIDLSAVLVVDAELFA